MRQRKRRTTVLRRKRVGKVEMEFIRIPQGQFDSRTVPRYTLLEKNALNLGMLSRAWQFEKAGFTPDVVADEEMRCHFGW